MAGTFEIKKAKDGEFFFHLKAGNGQIILASEMYKEKGSAETASRQSRKMRAMTPTTSVRTPRMVTSCST